MHHFTTAVFTSWFTKSSTYMRFTIRSTWFGICFDQCGTSTEQKSKSILQMINPQFRRFTKFCGFFCICCRNGQFFGMGLRSFRFNAADFCRYWCVLSFHWRKTKDHKCKLTFPFHSSIKMQCCHSVNSHANFFSSWFSAHHRTGILSRWSEHLHMAGIV